METVPNACEFCHKQDVVEIDRITETNRLILHCRSCGHSWSAFPREAADRRAPVVDRRKASRTDRRHRN
jgi:uncharacterized Zn finger protein